MTSLPTGVVTLLFTDIEGSTRLLEAGRAAYRAALSRHDAIIRQAVAGHGGVIFETGGDGFYAAFASPVEAARAALDVQLALRREPWGESAPIKVRMAVHTGELELRGEAYFGAPLHRCARLMDCAHGGQLLLSAATATLVGEGLPEGASLRDLGEYRLRDLVTPERIYQLVHPDLPADFPSLRTLTDVPNNLPRQATPFIGREQQLEAVRAALVRPDTRLVTLTGPGGTGKTRLALQAAADLLASFPDGVVFVPLASVTDSDLVPSAIAQALDVREAAGRPITTVLKDALRQEPLLLVLDNFEQVVAAAPAVAELLAATSGLKILVTSRAALRLYGERELAVPPLSLPDRRTAPSAAHLARFEAIHLFVDRAQAARSDFALDDANAADVAEICHRLDGLPLAIELAAARVRALPPRALLQRMERRLPLLTGGARDLPARQRTLRDAIAWSYDLLDRGEQTLFRRLAAFRGCTLETAEAVCAGEPPRPGATSVALPPLDLEILDGVESLVEKSLLRQEKASDGQPWYVMLETVREYALERLEESDEARAVHRRHVLAMLNVAETAEPELYGPEQTAWFARLEEEHDNLRAALDWSAEHRYAAPTLRLAVALWWFWAAHGHVDEGRERLAGLLALFPEDASDARAELRARALHGAGMLAASQGDYAAARALQEEGLTLRRALGEPHGLFNALEGLGTVALLEGGYVEARRYLEEALRIARGLEEPRYYASVMNTLGSVSQELGDLPAARAYIEESLAAYRRSTDHRIRAFNGAMLSLPIVAQEEGAYDEAQVLAAEAVSASRQTSNRRLEALALAIFGGIVLSLGDHAAARDRLRESIDVYLEVGDLAGVGQVLDRFVELAAAQGRFDGALQLAGAATALHERAGAVRTPRSQARLDRALEPARSSLSKEAADAAWRAGCALDVDEAITAALAITEPAAAGCETADPEPGADSAASPLTRREQEVAVLIARGLTNAQIAAELVITEGTAASHVNHILSKLEYGSRVQVAAWAAEQGLLADRRQV
jgi:predicted ATPase/class 3 adenylate cyclase/DNA-binding CsgD family transcriptional regulator